MADAPVVHIGENSPERVAYDLMFNIAAAEDRGIGGSKHGNVVSGKKPADREWILDTYSECLQAVKSNRPVKRRT